MQEIYRVIARLMGTDLTVMINGESGTGKELVARAMHDYGKRRGGPFVAVNMAAIPRELIESELFGHEKGAFTGANARKIGRFEQAEGGTLFLDEIGDMPLEAQTRLLRVLQSGEFMPVGGRTPIKADLRIIAATHRDLRQLIAPGPVPRGPVLPPERRADPAAAAARARRGHPGAGPAFPRPGARSRGCRPRRIEPDGDGAPQGLRLARQRARAREPGAPPGRALRPGDDRRRGDRGRAARGGAAGAAIGVELGDGRQPRRHASRATSTAVFERHDGRLPPAGLHGRILREVERPLIVQACSRRPAATRSRRRRCSASTATRCARRFASWTSR